MSHHKAAGKTRQHTSPAGKRLGMKATHGQKVTTGSILVRQRGSTFHAGKGTKLGKDYTLFAVTDGIVRFGKKLGKSIASVVSS